MKTILKVVAIVSGFVSMISAIWLACLYMDDILKHVSLVKEKFAKLVAKRR